MPCEVTDIGVENITLKPTPFEDARARDLDFREFVRQEDGIVDDDYDNMDLMERVEALQKHAVLLHFYPVWILCEAIFVSMNPTSRLRYLCWLELPASGLGRNKEYDDPVISSIGLEFIYNHDF